MKPAGDYEKKKKETNLSTFLVFVGGETRLWEGCSIFPYVLGILYGGAMLWSDIETYRGIPLKEESGWKKKNKKVGRAAACWFTVFLILTTRQYIYLRKKQTD